MEMSLAETSQQAKCDISAPEISAVLQPRSCPFRLASATNCPEGPSTPDLRALERPHVLSTFLSHRITQQLARKKLLAVGNILFLYTLLQMYINAYSPNANDILQSHCLLAPKHHCNVLHIDKHFRLVVKPPVFICSRR